MLENKLKNVTDLDSFKESIYGQAQDICVPIAHNVFCIRFNIVLYMQCCLYITTSSRFIVFRFIPLPLIIHLLHVWGIGHCADVFADVIILSYRCQYEVISAVTMLPVNQERSTVRTVPDSTIN